MVSYRIFGCNVAAADPADVTDDADSDLDMPDDLLDPSDDEDRKRDTSSTTTSDDKVDDVEVFCPKRTCTHCQTALIEPEHQ